MNSPKSLIIALAFGCGAPEEPSPEPYTAEGEHVVMTAEEGLKLCAGSMRHMDDFVTRLADDLGVEPPAGDARIHYHWVTADEVDERCGEGTNGCAPGNEVYAKYAPLNHELVHAVAVPIGLPRPLFVEGLAVAYGGMGSGPIKVFGRPATTDPRDLAVVSSAELVALGAYSIAGAFTAFLIDRHGLDDYLRVYAAIGRSADYDSIDRAFREVFAETFEDSAVAYEASTKKTANAWTIDMKLMECSAPEMAWDGKSLAVERSLSCDDEDAVGPYDNKVVVYHTITIDEGGYYELRMAGDTQPSVAHPDFSYGNIPVRGVSLYICSAEGYWMATWVGSTPREKYLGPGRYSMRFHGPAAEAVTFGFTLKRVPDPPVPSP